MSLWLDNEELAVLTGYKHRAKQIKVLAAMRVKFRVRPQDSFPLVDRSQFEAKEQSHGAAA